MRYAFFGLRSCLLACFMLVMAVTVSVAQAPPVDVLDIRTNSQITRLEAAYDKYESVLHEHDSITDNSTYNVDYSVGDVERRDTLIRARISTVLAWKTQIVLRYTIVNNLKSVFTGNTFASSVGLDPDACWLPAWETEFARLSHEVNGSDLPNSTTYNDRYEEIEPLAADLLTISETVAEIDAQYASFPSTNSVTGQPWTLAQIADFQAVLESWLSDFEADLNELESKCNSVSGGVFRDSEDLVNDLQADVLVELDIIATWYTQLTTFLYWDDGLSGVWY